MGVSSNAVLTRRDQEGSVLTRNTSAAVAVVWATKHNMCSADVSIFWKSGSAGAGDDVARAAAQLRPAIDDPRRNIRAVRPVTPPVVFHALFMQLQSQC